jgi:hypothetical protein
MSQLYRLGTNVGRYFTGDDIQRIAHMFVL